MQSKNNYKAPKWPFASAVLIVYCVVAAFAFNAYLESRTITNPSPTTTETIYENGFPRVDWAYWQSINPDIIGWITIPGTSIDFPIVQA